MVFKVTSYIILLIVCIFVFLYFFFLLILVHNSGAVVPNIFEAAALFDILETSCGPLKIHILGIKFYES